MTLSPHPSEPQPTPEPEAADLIDVVVVTYNSAEVVDRLLDSIPAAMGWLPFRVVVVDNSSPDRTREVVAARGDCDLVEAPNDGYAAGINRGVDALAGSGPILVLNPDLSLAPGAVPEMAGLLATPGTGVVVPVLRDTDGTTSRSLRRWPTLLRSTGFGDSRFPLLSEVVNEPEEYARVHEIEWATGALMLIKRGCYEAVGAFDESFFMYSEETEFCLRARQSGYATVFTPHAAAVHAEGASGRNPDLYAMQVLNRIRLYRRSHRLPASSALFALVLARETVWAIRGNADSRATVRALVSPARKPALLPWPGGPLSSPGAVPRRIGRE
ncbi:MAG: glycosyltransferase family 2 protein [Dehalococcoidia bacterium]